MRSIACIIVFAALIGLAPAAFGSGFTFSTIDVPGASSTEALGINNAGQIVGFFKDNIGSGQHGFLYDRGTFTTIDVPGAAATIPFGINNAGQIVGDFVDNAGLHGFLYDRGTPSRLSMSLAPRAPKLSVSTTAVISSASSIPHPSAINGSGSCMTAAPSRLSMSPAPPASPSPLASTTLAGSSAFSTTHKTVDSFTIAAPSPPLTFLVPPPFASASTTPAGLSANSTTA